MLDVVGLLDWVVIRCCLHGARREIRYEVVMVHCFKPAEVVWDAGRSLGSSRLASSYHERRLGSAGRGRFGGGPGHGGYFDPAGIVLVVMRLSCGLGNWQ